MHRDSRLRLCLVILLVAGAPIPAAAQARELSYLGAVTDYDNYILAIAADLRTLRHQAGVKDADLELAGVQAFAIHRATIVSRDSGWLLQPGAWRDHPDHRFAGRSTAPDADAPLARVEEGATDASHFSRWPLFLQTFESSWPSTHPARTYYEGLRTRLAWQFRRHVLIPPDPSFRGWRTTNFMDGGNGVYRWDYQSHRGTGYLPYQLSSTLLLGWWSFLGDSLVARAYAEMFTGFPYGPIETRTYAGPWGRQSRMTDGRYRLCTLLASKLDPPAPPSAGEAAMIDSLWQSWGPQRLRTPLWRGSEAEMAPYDLMIPLHFAFRAGGEGLQRSFAEHFARFEASAWEPAATSLFQRLHYTYFATRFLVLATEARRPDLIPPGLEARLLAEWRVLWNGQDEVVSRTGWGEPTFKAFRPYFEWKLAHWSGS